MAIRFPCSADSGRAIRFVSGLAIALATAHAGTAFAQSAPSDAAATGEAAPSDGDIIVTARKRSETVQSVPASVGVIGSAALESSGVSSLRELGEIAPGINMATAPAGSETGITIRGLGSAPGVPSFDSSVSLFVDGVYAPRSREFSSSMFDIERIEVIRGTQAALLGKNTSLGAINLTTRKPGDKLAVDMRASYEIDRGSTLVAGGIDVPLGDTLAVRVSGQFTNDRGYIHNTVLDTYSPRSRDWAGRAVLQWEPSADFDVTLMAQHDLLNAHGTPAEFIQTDGTPELLAALAGYPGSVEANLDRSNSTIVGGADQWERLLVDKYAATANLQLGNFTLTSVTGYSRYSDRNLGDTDFQPGEYLSRGVDEVGKQFSQELRIVSPSDKPFDFILGGLYLKGSLVNHTTQVANYPFGPLPGVNIVGGLRTDFDQDNDAVSLFGQANYKLTDRFRVTLGGRWTREHKEVDLGRVILDPGLFSVVIFPPFAPFSLSRTEKNFDYSFGAQYDLSPDAMIYASYGQGTKSGGFAQSVTDLTTAPYEKEVARTAEVGLKLQDPGRRWTFNIAAFDTEVDNFQLVTFTGLAFIVGNTDLRSRGFEIESSWRPLDGLRLYWNNTFADAKDRNTGNQIPLSPKWSGTAGFSLRRGWFGNIDGIIEGSVDYRGSRYYQQDPATSPASKQFTTLNLSAAISDTSDRWELRLIGRNLTDANALAFAFPTPIIAGANQNGISERGRTVAVQASVRF